MRYYNGEGVENPAVMGDYYSDTQETRYYNELECHYDELLDRYNSIKYEFDEYIYFAQEGHLDISSYSLSQDFPDYRENDDWDFLERDLEEIQDSLEDLCDAYFSFKKYVVSELGEM